MKKRLTIGDWKQQELKAYLTNPTDHLLQKAQLTDWPETEGITEAELAHIEHIERRRAV